MRSIRRYVLYVDVVRLSVVTESRPRTEPPFAGAHQVLLTLGCQLGCENCPDTHRAAIALNSDSDEASS